MIEPATGDQTSHRLFRKKALERLMVPDQLDQPLYLARPKGWLTVLAVGLLLATATLWAIWGSITDVMTAQGTVARVSARSAAFDLVLYVPRKEAAILRAGLDTRLVPLSNGGTSKRVRGLIRSVSIVPSRGTLAGHSAGKSGVKVRVNIRLHANGVGRRRSSVFVGTTLPTPGTRWSVTIITGKRSPLGELIR